jgi:hypothetical protein
MALTDPKPAGFAFQTAPVSKTFRDSPPDRLTGDPKGALARLLRLHDEARLTFHQSQLLDRAPSACLGLMLTGGLILAWTAQEGGAALEAGFVWSLWLLTGITAITVITVRGFARHPALKPLESAVGELHKFLLYTGLAWGLGGFAVMPDRPDIGLIFAFVALPCLAMTLSLKDAKAALAFSGPATLLCAGAALLRGWPLGLIAILAAGAVSTFMLQRVIRAGRDPLSHLPRR